MKHPKHRIGDVLRWHPDARREAYDFVTDAVYSSLPKWILDLVAEVQHVGSMTWASAKLRSDMDFNIALKKDVTWLEYAHARRWYYSGQREPLKRRLMEYEKKFGLQLDLGIMDVEADAYNIYVSIPKMLLFHRRNHCIDEFTVGSAGINCSIDDPNPIDLNTFNPAVDEVPPALDLHLRWDGYHSRWRRESYIKPWKVGTHWALSEERWPDEVEKWRNYYGKHFLEYKYQKVERGGATYEELVPA